MFIYIYKYIQKERHVYYTIICQCMTFHNKTNQQYHVIQYRAVTKVKNAHGTAGTPLAQTRGRRQNVHIRTALPAHHRL